MTVDGIPAHHLRFNRSNDDVLDVWVDAADRVVQAARLSKTPVPIQLRLRSDYLGDAPDIPDLPDVVDPQASG